MKLTTAALVKIMKHEAEKTFKGGTIDIEYGEISFRLAIQGGEAVHTSIGYQQTTATRDLEKIFS